MAHQKVCMQCRDDIKVRVYILVPFLHHWTLLCQLCEKVAGMGLLIVSLLIVILLIISF